MNTAFAIVSIPLNKLVASPLNVRKTGGQTIEDLAAVNSSAWFASQPRCGQER
jgi:hypothetical protein